MIDRGGFADEQGIELRQPVIVGPADQLDAEALPARRLDEMADALVAAQLLARGRLIELSATGDRTATAASRGDGGPAVVSRSRSLSLRRWCRDWWRQTAFR